MRTRILCLWLLTAAATSLFAQDVRVRGERLEIYPAETGGPAIAIYNRDGVTYPFGSLPAELNGKVVATSTPEKTGPAALQGTAGDRVYIAVHYPNVRFSAWKDTGKTFRVGDITYYLFYRTLSTTGTWYNVPPAQEGVSAPTLVFGSTLKWDDPLPLPGVVVARAFRAIVAPAIVVLPDGSYLATCQGARDGEKQWISRDRGRSWAPYGEQGWYSKYASTFRHRDRLYVIGVNLDTEGRGVLLKESLDNGLTWSKTVELFDQEGEISGIPSPVVEAQGRLWRAFSWASTDKRKQNYAETFLLSAPVDADLTDPGSWTATNFLPRQGTGFDGRILKLFEPNAVRTSSGEVVVLARNNGASPTNTSIMRAQSPTSLTVDTENDIIEFPGANQKFCVRFDDRTGRYWALANVGREGDTPNNENLSAGRRNRLVLQSSPDLRNWTEEQVVLFAPDPRYHGFQYPYFVFEDDDIIFVSRTAFEDEDGLPVRQHDANYLTFHRVEDFRGDYPDQDLTLEPGTFFLRNVATRNYLQAGADFAVTQAESTTATDTRWNLLPSSEGYFFLDGLSDQRGPLAASPRPGTVRYLAERYNQSPYVNREWEAIPVAPDVFQFRSKDAARGYLASSGPSGVVTTLDAGSTATHWTLSTAAAAASLASPIAETRLSATLFPNPTAGAFTVNYPEQGIESLALYTFTGQLILERDAEPGEASYTIDRQLEAGSYLLVLRETDGRETTLPLTVR